MQLKDVTPTAGKNCTALEGELRASRGDGVIMLKPQTRYFSDPPTETNEAAIETFWNGQLYTVIGKPDPSGGWQLRLWWKPFVTLIWAGGALIAFGGALALLGGLWRRATRSPHGLATGALRVSRVPRFAPLCPALMIVGARLAARDAGDTDVSSKLEGKPLPAFDAAAGRRRRSRHCRRRSWPRGSRTSSTSSPAGACHASAKCRCFSELKRRGVAIDGIAVRDTSGGVAGFLARNGDPYERIGSDPQSPCRSRSVSSGVPESFIVDGKGVIRYQHIGPIERLTCR